MIAIESQNSRSLCGAYGMSIVHTCLVDYFRFILQQFESDGIRTAVHGIRRIPAELA